MMAMKASVMAPTPPQQSLIKYLMFFALIGVVGILLADVVHEGDASSMVKEIMTFLTPIGAVLFVLAKQDEVKATVEKGLNGDLDKRIREAVRDELEKWTKPGNE